MSIREMCDMTHAEYVLLCRLCSRCGGDAYSLWEGLYIKDGHVLIRS